VNDPDVADAARRISAYQVALALKSPSTRRVGPFYARFDPGDPNPFGNYAIPEPGARPSAADVAALVRTYAEQERRPRLEYIAASAPAVEPALVTAGFVVEDRPALMACAQGAEGHLLPSQGIILVRPSSDKDLLAVIAVQREAFGDPTPAGPADVAGIRSSIERGAIVVLAREESTGEAAGAGVCTLLESGVTEIAGIGVRPSFRRRGIASAVTARLTADSFSRGATLAWLTPGDEDAQRIYARAGFQPIGEMLMISLPRLTR
jgi:ribosomal protein S18 acetylase RimI-like enzyme